MTQRRARGGSRRKRPDGQSFRTSVSAHGIDAVLTPSEEAKQHYPLLLAGKYDMLAGTVGTSVLYIKNADDLQYVTLLDDSNGGDGVVAGNEVTTLAGLKGKTIGVNVASVS